MTDIAETESTVGAPAPESQRRLRRVDRLSWGLLVRPAFLVAVLVVLWVWVHGKTQDSIEHRNLTHSALSTALVQHIKLSIVATVLTVAIAVPLGITLTRRRARPIRPFGLLLGNLGQAIPSIGLVTLLDLWIGPGFWTAIVGLVAYSALPVLRNTMVGIQQVDPALIEAARGMGMSRPAVLARVELPLAVPVMLAGIRTALVLTVATATLVTIISAGGLGDGLVAGINLNRPSLSFTYGVIAAVLALFADWLGGLAERLLSPQGV